MTHYSLVLVARIFIFLLILIWGVKTADNLCTVPNYQNSHAF